MITKLSPTKQKIYEIYKKYWKHITYKKLSENLWIQVSAIFKHVQDLVDMWYLQKYSDWSIGVLDISDTEKIPLLWEISCGKPIYIFEIYDTISAPKNLLKGGGEFYALQAKWDSMKDAGILSWDYLIIRQQTDIEDGSIWVLIQKDDFDEYATLKQIFHTKSWVLAKPKSPLFESFVLSNKEAEIRWKLMWVIRDY